jgi:DNA-binding CsgD family transcriptional regulator
MRRASSAHELSSTAGPLFEELGLPHFALARFFRVDGTPDVSILAGTFHTGWAARYIECGYGAQSQIVGEILKSNDPFSWADVVARGMDDRQKRIKEEAMDFGLNDGLFTPWRWVDGSFAAVALAGPKPNLDDCFVRTSAGVVSSYFAAEMRRLSSGGQTSAERLSDRQRECLAWVRQGKSSSMIGEILGLSVRTVDEHLNQACRKLGVRTRVQAAVEASLAGLID